jgi:hypothetical protein
MSHAQGFLESFWTILRAIPGKHVRPVLVFGDPKVIHIDLEPVDNPEDEIYASSKKRLFLRAGQLFVVRSISVRKLSIPRVIHKSVDNWCFRREPNPTTCAFWNQVPQRAQALVSRAFPTESASRVESGA